MNESKTINKRWFKNQLLKGNFLMKCKAKYSDDYAFDASNNYGIEKEFTDANPTVFTKWYIDSARIYGSKEGIINFVFASCEYYEFKLKTV